MAKQAIGLVFQALDLDSASAVPLYQQLYDRLRDSLLSGAIPAGQRLPSTRTLALDLDLSRNTVTAAFERLLDEGFIDSRVGDGSYVSQALGSARQDGMAGPMLRRTAAAAGQVRVGTGNDNARSNSARSSLSRRGQVIASHTLGRDPDQPAAFSVGIPALDEFPASTWRRLASRRVRQMAKDDLLHGSLRGNARLRRLIALHVNTFRGMRCEPEQVVMLPSAQLGLDMLSRLLLDPGDVAWIENPGYLGARGALTSAGVRLLPVPVDDEGLKVDVGRQLEPRARLAYVSPSHQYPLGASMSLSRRLQLLAWAEEAGSWIIEDDYDSEYRYAGASTQALQGLDHAGRVLYLGTFSKVLFPALRLAYLIVPHDLIEALKACRFLTDGHAPRWSQEVLADFMEAGHLTAHIRRMRSLYKERRDVFLAEMERRFGTAFHFSGIEAGMHVAGRWPGWQAGSDLRLAELAAAEGLDLAPLSRYFLPGSTPESEQQGITFGYSHVPPGEIVRACGLLEPLIARM